MQPKDLIPVKDNANLARDPATMAVLNVNQQAYINHRNAQQIARERDREFQQMKDDIIDLKIILKKVLDKLS